MKIRVELPQALLEEARRVAASDSTTFSELVESGLRREIAYRSGASRFVLRDASFHGNGLAPDVAGESWENLRRLADRESS